MYVEAELEMKKTNYHWKKDVVYSQFKDWRLAVEQVKVSETSW